jgi:rod shape-determining protein MreD
MDASLELARCRATGSKGVESMSDFPIGFVDPRKKDRIARYKWAAVAGIVVAAILFQVYIPPFFNFLAYLEMPLLVTVYFSIMRRSPVTGVLIGMVIGLAQDSLSPNHPLGLFGIVKTLVGYFSGFMAQRFDVQNPWSRLAIAFFFFVFHQFFYWVLGSALLGLQLSFEPGEIFVMAALNAAVAVPLYHILDKLRVSD